MLGLQHFTESPNMKEWTDKSSLIPGAPAIAENRIKERMPLHKPWLQTLNGMASSQLNTAKHDFSTGTQYVPPLMGYAQATAQRGLVSKPSTVPSIDAQQVANWDDKDLSKNLNLIAQYLSSQGQGTSSQLLSQLASVKGNDTAKRQALDAWVAVEQTGYGEAGGSSMAETYSVLAQASWPESGSQAYQQEVTFLAYICQQQDALEATGKVIVACNPKPVSYVQMFDALNESVPGRNALIQVARMLIRGSTGANYGDLAQPVMPSVAATGYYIPNIYGQNPQNAQFWTTNAEVGTSFKQMVLVTLQSLCWAYCRRGAQTFHCSRPVGTQTKRHLRTLHQ
jgi:hypothetical protein